ncbi:acyl carrier protein [Streptomyces sp. NPDC001822]|uniref:acyl carrier protein n=1 Tax=Streptomyces sp. NPDC001822 TaxID=3364614 RepID=UPI0036C6085F
MRNRDEIMALVATQLATVLPLTGRVLQESDVLRELPEIDSLNLVRVAAGLEKECGVQFDDATVFGAKTVGDLVDGLSAALAAKA